MKEPLTDELLSELLDSPDPAKFARKHRITQRNLPDYLQQLLAEKGLERADVVREAGLDATSATRSSWGNATPRATRSCRSSSR